MSSQPQLPAKSPEETQNINQRIHHHQQTLTQGTQSQQGANYPISYARMANNSAHPKKEQGIILDVIESADINDYLIALAKVVPSTAIRYISRISQSRINVFLESRELVDKLINEKMEITVKQTKLLIKPYVSRNKRIVLSNVSPIIPNSYIEGRLQELGIQLKSTIQNLKAGSTIPGFAHVYCFRRQTYIAPEDEHKVPPSFLLTFEGTPYRIFTANDSLKCFICNNIGHIAKDCQQVGSSSQQSDLSSQQDNLSSEKIPDGGPSSQQSADASPPETPGNQESATQHHEENKSPTSENRTPRAPRERVRRESSAITAGKPAATPNQAQIVPEGKSGKRPLSPTSTSDSNQTLEVQGKNEHDELPSDTSDGETEDTDSNSEIAYEKSTNHPKRKQSKKLKTADNDKTKTPDNDKKKTLESETETVWENIKAHLDDPKCKDIYPLTGDQFHSFFETAKGQQNLADLVSEYTDDITGLITMCNEMHPKMNQNLKNRCTRMMKKLQAIEPQTVKSQPESSAMETNN